MKIKDVRIKKVFLEAFGEARSVVGWGTILIGLLLFIVLIFFWALFTWRINMTPEELAQEHKEDSVRNFGVVVYNMGGDSFYVSDSRRTRKGTAYIFYIAKNAADSTKHIINEHLFGEFKHDSLILGRLGMADDGTDTFFQEIIFPKIYWQDSARH